MLFCVVHSSVRCVGHLPVCSESRSVSYFLFLSLRGPSPVWSSEQMLSIMPILCCVGDTLTIFQDCPLYTQSCKSNPKQRADTVCACTMCRNAGHPWRKNCFPMAGNSQIFPSELPMVSLTFFPISKVDHQDWNPIRFKVMVLFLKYALQIFWFFLNGSLKKKVIHDWLETSTFPL